VRFDRAPEYGSSIGRTVAGRMTKQHGDIEGVGAGAICEYRFPDFLCIGAQKAGTSWLDRNLRRHPKLWLPPMKELQYFSELYIPAARKWTARQRQERGTQIFNRHLERNAPSDRDYRLLARIADIISGPISDDWYGRIFALAQSDQICGEVTPDYATLPDEGIRHILKLSPKVRIILSLRDPIARSWSHIRMVTQTRDIDDLGTLEQFAAGADQIQRADYAAIIANWRRFISEDRFLVIFLDDIEKTPEAVLGTVCDFLGVERRDKAFAKAGRPIHVGEASEIPPSVEAILKERLRPAYEGIAALYPEIGAAWMARHYG
jgi:hypothetical protein